MPTYDYRCDACGNAFAAVQRFSDAQLDSCPRCGAVPRRVPSLPAVVFKGSGWYVNESRSRKDKQERASDGASGAATPSADGKKPGEAKTAEKAAAPGKTDSSAAE